jgi:hypothetical protein
MAQSQTPSMPPDAGKQPGSLRSLNLRGLFLTVIVDAGLAYLIYVLAVPHFPSNSVYPLLLASVPPILGNVFSVVRNRRLDFLAILILLGITFSLITALVTGDQKLLLIRESFLTGGYGLTCLISLVLFPRPLMFYFIRHAVTGNDPERVRDFNARWNNPLFRRFQRIITLVWGIGLFGELIIRIVMIYALSVAAVLAISPIVLNVISILLILWTIQYGRRTLPQIAQSVESERVLSEPAS